MNVWPPVLQAADFTELHLQKAARYLEKRKGNRA